MIWKTQPITSFLKGMQAKQVPLGFLRTRPNKGCLILLIGAKRMFLRYKAVVATQLISQLKTSSNYRWFKTALKHSLKVF